MVMITVPPQQLPSFLFALFSFTPFPLSDFLPRLIGIFHNNINKITIIITIEAVFYVDC